MTHRVGTAGNQAGFPNIAVGLASNLAGCWVINSIGNVNNTLAAMYGAHNNCMPRFRANPGNLSVTRSQFTKDISSRYDDHKPITVFGSDQYVYGTLATMTQAVSVTVVYTVSLSGSMSPTTSLVKQISKTILGAISPTGALTNQTRKPFSGAISPTGSLTNQTNKPFSGAISPTSSLVRQPGKALAGS